MKPSRLKNGLRLGAAAVSAVLLSASIVFVLSRLGDRGSSPPADPNAPVGPSLTGSTSPSADSPDLSSVIGTWEFVSLTGVPLSLLPPGALRGPRDDIVIRADGSFRWGHWSGFVKFDVAGGKFGMFPTQPGKLQRRFEEYNAGVGISIVHGRMQVWLPDLGQDRDVDVGQSQEDIDSPDMLFRRAGS